MRLLPIFALFLLSHCQVVSQQIVDLKTAPESLVKDFKEAKRLFANSKDDDAKKLLDKLLRKNPGFVDAILLKAEMHEVRREFDDAVEAYTKGLQLNPEYQLKAWYFLGRTYASFGKYDDCVKALDEYLKRGKPSEPLWEYAHFMREEALLRSDAEKNPPKTLPQNLGPNVNTADCEHLPSISGDGTLLIFTRQIGLDGDAEDFYASRLSADGTWAAAANVGGPINTPANEGGQSITADGRKMVFARCKDPDNVGRCDLWESQFVNGTWTRPVNLGPEVNSTEDDRMCSLSPNGDWLVFASSRGGGKGAEDLYVCKLAANGKWGKPQNISELNTDGSDNCPFLHFDGKTLYFRSSGYPGLGKGDLYMSTLQPDGKWGKPKNLGPAINSPKDEGGLVVGLDGKWGYFNSSRTGEGYGCQDLYRIEMPQSARPNAVTYVKVIAKDASTKEPLSVSAILREVSDGGKEYRQNTDNTGSFMLCLPVGFDYSLAVEKQGYLFYSDQFILSEGYTPEKPFEFTVWLQKVPAKAPPSTESKPVVLKNILFESGSAKLLRHSDYELGKLYDLLTTNPTMSIAIHGHTDNVGAEAANLALSEQRAQAVVAYLTAKGIHPSRLAAKGFGESVTIDTNDTPQGRSNNRRTEFVIVGM